MWVPEADLEHAHDMLIQYSVASAKMSVLGNIALQTMI